MEEAGILEKILEELKKFNNSNTDISQRLDALENRDELYSVSEVATLFKVSKATVYNKIKKGLLHEVQRGCKNGILKSEIQKIKYL